MHSRQAGLTLVEVTVSCILIAAIVGFTMASVAAINNVGQQNDVRTREQGGYRSVLAQLRDELADTTTDMDPITNELRYGIVTDANGKQVLRIRKLVGATLSNGELQATWSGWITWTVRPDGFVVRDDGSNTRIVGSGIKEMRYVVTPNGRFEVNVVTTLHNPANGRLEERTYREWILPRM
jgi:hypothetical protein